MYLFVVVFSFLIEWDERGKSSAGHQVEQTTGTNRAAAEMSPFPPAHLLSSGSSFINAINISIACLLPLHPTPFMVALSGTEIRLDLVCLRPSLLSPLFQSNYVTTSLFQLQLQLPNPQLQILTSSARLVVFQTCEMSFISRHPFWQLTCQVFSTKINELRLAARQTRLVLVGA